MRGDDPGEGGHPHAHYSSFNATKEGPSIV
jgi:hypothetical protein